MEQTITTTGTSSWYGNCKYHLPCGYCELKKTDCNCPQIVSMPYKDDWYKVTPTWEQKMNEVNCSAERGKDGET